ncbi:MAG: hypothetical protein EOO10_15460, partial [Chitinophagaceae bacterium]
SYTDANLLYNRFVGKKKLSLYATKSNTNTGSLNWEDQRRLGMNDFEFDELSGYFMSSGGYDETFDSWNLRGLPDAYTAGGLYSNKFNGEKQNVNLSYRYNRLGTTNDQSILTQNILPDTMFYSNQYSKSKSLNQQNAVNGKWELKFDSLNSLRFTTAFTRKVTDYNTNTRTESLSEERDTVNTGYKENDGRTTKIQSDNALQYKRLFKKAGRQLVANVRLNLSDDDGLGYLAFTNRFFRNRVLDSTSVSDQQKINKTHSETFGGKITYAEPLSTKITLVVEYAYNQNNATSKRNTFEKANNGKYEQYIPQFSNNFDFKASSNTGSVFGRYNTKKWRASVGGGVSAVQLDLLNKDDNSKRKYNFLNLTPQSSIGYNIKPNTNISFNYRGGTVQPNIEQLQPLRNNIDPLNLVEGNPDLEVGFRHNLSLYYNDYRMLKQMGIWVGGNYTFTDNAITNITIISDRGVKTTKPINVDGNKNWNVWGEWNKGEGEKKLIYTAGFNGNGGTNNNFINGLANRTTYYNVSFSFGLRYEVDQKWSLNFRPKIGYNSSLSSLNKAAKTNFLQYGGESEGRLNLPGNIELRTDINVDMRQRLSAFAANPNITIWNAEINKKVFKNKSGIISLLARDILNNNRGFDRIINSNFITEDRYQRVSQYFMLKFEWSFNKMGGE